MDEGDLYGATNDGIDPKPPTGTEDGAGYTWPKNGPYLGEIHLCLPSFLNGDSSDSRSVHTPATIEW